MRSMHWKPFGLTLCLAAATAAQDARSPLSLVPRTALFVMQADAPAAWADTFAGTRVGAFFDGPAIRDAIAPLREEFDLALDEARQAGTADANELMDLVRNARGRVTVAADVALGAVDEDPEMRVMFALTPAAEDDVERMAELFARVLEEEWAEEGIATVDEPFGPATLRVGTMGGDEDSHMSVPQVLDGSLVFFVWTGPPEAIGAWSGLTAAERFEPDAKLDGAVAMKMSTGAILGDLARLAEDAPLPFDVRAILERFGLLAIREVELTVQPDGEFVAVDMGMRWEGDGGMFEAFVPRQPGAPKLLDITPRNAPVWSVSTLRVGALYDVIAGIWDDNADLVPMTREDAERAFEESFKIRLRQDLIDTLGGEMLTVADQDTFADEDFEDPLYQFAGQGIAIELADPARFAESFETMLRARGMHAARKTTDYRGFALHRLRLAGLVVLDYAITDRVFAFAVNTDDPSQLRAILDEEAARRAGEAPAEMPDAVAERLAHVADGWVGLSVTDVTVLATLFRTAFETTLEEEGFDAPPEELADVMETVARLEGALRDASLSRMVSATWAQPGRLRARLVW